ncbi:PHP-associated domain-containing protein [Alkalicoccobacillus gibsonii]|uniref:PHP-associated domain-containing protein n=1 Tax=Alkalicoccobacillus gibsonii TaxID=79881 RepID=UPI0019323F6B|nr:PHP-associated domain-containing protein [Alkalicoccobacillus gibsonii]MBM0065704.1 PHP domain-containing protein [Alkalicoccobacillus gibsonii]
MNIDFHTHVKLAKRVDFDRTFFEEMVLNAREVGLDALAMTEHFNTNRFYDIYQQLDQRFEYKGNYYDVDGFKVFTGMEIDVREVGHILFIGHRDDLLYTRNQLEDHTTKDTFIPFAELLQIGESFDFLKIGAHPMRSTTPLTQHAVDQLQRLDAFDLNGKDLFEHGIETMERNVLAFAESISRPVVCGSDSHHPIHLGAVHNQFSHQCETASELKKVIQEGSYTRVISPVLNTKIAAAKIVKKQMKEELIAKM